MHAYERISERIDNKNIKFETICMYAKKNGLGHEDLPTGPLKSYLYFKHKQKNKRAKLYKGYVFIFFINSKRLITCYPLPEKYKEEYGKILKEIDIQKKSSGNKNDV